MISVLVVVTLVKASVVVLAIVAVVILDLLLLVVILCRIYSNCYSIKRFEWAGRYMLIYECLLYEITIVLTQSVALYLYI